MKKLRIAISALICLAVFTGAAPWEGPAAAAMGGELPDEGYYVATNSFPRNTVVDVLNLETGKTIRVIVAAGLDSPGFLAILSRKAAAEVGLQGRSVARIRMSQPEDPIALSRFIDGASPSIDPDYNPRADGTGRTNPVPAEAVLPPEPSNPASGDQRADIPPAFPPNREDGDWSLHPAENRPPDAPAYQGALPPDAELAPFSRSSPEGTPAAPAIDGSLFIAPIERLPPGGGFPSPVQSASEGAYTGIMAPIETVPPIRAFPSASPGEDRLPPEMAAAEIAPIERIPPISPAASLPFLPPEKGAAGGAAFSVPLINSLERNKYYLQLRAFSQAETVNQELAKIGKAYPLVILSGEESGKTIYRILLGPINQGESAALLQRFKNMGYTDAFLRPPEGAP